MKELPNVGDIVTILKKPNMYSSRAGKNPLNLDYPFTGTVEEVLSKEIGSPVSINGYGFSFNYPGDGTEWEYATQKINNKFSIF